MGLFGSKKGKKKADSGKVTIIRPQTKNEAASISQRVTKVSGRTTKKENFKTPLEYLDGRRWIPDHLDSRLYSVIKAKIDSGVITTVDDIRYRVMRPLKKEFIDRELDLNLKTRTIDAVINAMANDLAEKSQLDSFPGVLAQLYTTVSGAQINSTPTYTPPPKGDDFSVIRKPTLGNVPQKTRTLETIVNKADRTQWLTENFEWVSAAAKVYLTAWKEGEKPSTVVLPSNEKAIVTAWILDGLLDEVAGSDLVARNYNASYLLALRAQLLNKTDDFHEYGLATAELLGVRIARSMVDEAKDQQGYDQPRPLSPVKVDNRYVTNEDFAELFVELAASLYQHGDKANAIALLGAFKVYSDSITDQSKKDTLDGLTQLANELHGRMKLEAADEQLNGIIKTMEQLRKIVYIYKEVIGPLEDGQEPLYFYHPDAENKRAFIEAFNAYEDLCRKLSTGQDVPSADEQINVYSNMVKVASAYIEGRMKLAEACVKGNKTQGAIQVLRKTEELDPNNVDVLTLLGRCYMDEGNFLQAQVKFEKAYQLLELGAIGFRTTKFKARTNLTEVRDMVYLTQGNDQVS